ncbi:TIGR00730 family Rossman fold protein [uncultured Martelella sp.]|uniref:LOG family protein n=1 Tax=uncultured Martelella sp. TaxID=392331 RepID=UPI0029C8413A|nr:TIGR00730 family Rossman fold protein [uncultured Martelella sp.]
MSARNIKSIAVFCGSNTGGAVDFADGARALGTALARAGIQLVYGGTTKGLMGEVADAALEGNGEIHGVITRRLMEKGHAHEGLTRSEVAEPLRARKERMVELADAFIALPGGIGTLEEFMETWTMNQLGEIDKPVGLLNTLGFFEPFLGFIDHMVASRFLPPEHRHSVCVDADPAVLVNKLRSFERTTVPKWL